MTWKPSRAARYVLPVSVLAFALVGTGVTVANARNVMLFGQFGRGMMNGNGAWPQSQCKPTSAKGSLVRFRAVDAGGMMGGAMLRLMPMAQVVKAGKVTIELANVGSMPHELLVFPLAAGAIAGERAVLASDRIAEDASVGEVEPACPQPADLDGIAPGNVARATLTLAPGRYEVACNLPGHYRVGMFAALEVR